MSSTPNSTVEASTTSSSPASCMASNNNAPKYGTRVPNRVFVGGLSADTTEAEMESVFSTYGTVTAVKIISDRAGVSKGYGFITFETEEQARELLRKTEVYLKNRKLNIAPAIKKQYDLCASFQPTFARTGGFDASTSPSVPTGSVYFSTTGVPYTIPNNYYPSTQQDAATTYTGYHAGSTPYSAYPYMYPTAAAAQTLFTPQQYTYQTMQPHSHPVVSPIMHSPVVDPSTIPFPLPSVQTTPQQQPQQQSFLPSDLPFFTIYQSPMVEMFLNVEANNQSDDDENTQQLVNSHPRVFDPICFTTPPPPILHSHVTEVPIWSPMASPPYYGPPDVPRRGVANRRGRGGRRGARGGSFGPSGDYSPPQQNRELKTRRPPRLNNAENFTSNDQKTADTECGSNDTELPSELVSMMQTVQVTN